MKKLKKKILFTAIFLVVFLLFGVVTYCIIERWGFFDSAFFAIMTLLTVGTGDFVPTTDSSKGFTIFFIIGSIMLLLYLAFLIFAYYRLYKDKPEHWIEIKNR